MRTLLALGIALACIAWQSDKPAPPAPALTVAPAAVDHSDELARILASLESLSDRISELETKSVAVTVAPPAKPVTLPAPVVVPKQPAAAAKPQPARTAGADKLPAQPRYPVRPSNTWWSGCSNWTHLTRGEHAGVFDSNWLRSLSNAELQSLHSDHHDEERGRGRVKWEYVVRPASKASSNVVRSSNCPGGRCPTSSTTYSRGFRGLRLFNR